MRIMSNKPVQLLFCNLTQGGVRVILVMGRSIAAQLNLQKVSEKDVLNDFRQFKKNIRKVDR